MSTKKSKQTNDSKQTAAPSREELHNLLAAAVDGIDGYESETGYLRYWNDKKIQRAREVIDAGFCGSDPEEAKARAVAEALGGEAWQSGGGIWLTVITKTDGHLVVISDDVICAYESEAAFEQGRPTTTIHLQNNSSIQTTPTK